jgi:hypothetical protein
MAMGRRKKRERQQDLWIEASAIVEPKGNTFYDRLREHAKLWGCAGLNRHVAGDERALQERRERLHPDPESCRQRREARLEA